MDGLVSCLACYDVHRRVNEIVLVYCHYSLIAAVVMAIVLVGLVM